MGVFDFLSERKTEDKLRSLCVCRHACEPIVGPFQPCRHLCVAGNLRKGCQHINKSKPLECHTTFYKLISLAKELVIDSETHESLNGIIGVDIS